MIAVFGDVWQCLMVSVGVLCVLGVSLRVFWFILCFLGFLGVFERQQFFT